MKPAVCFPLHDSEGILLDHLEKNIANLKKYFSKCFISWSWLTLNKFAERLNLYFNDPFFCSLPSKENFLIGDQLSLLYEIASKNSLPDQVLHLCSSDRLIFALESQYKKDFVKDVVWSQKQKNPVVFTRSSFAWKTHPQNYYAIETMVTRVGEIYFNEKLDFCWCHSTIKAGLLKKILPQIKASDWTIVSKYILKLKKQLINKEVDWLSWEDPLILGLDEKKLKKERENNPLEVEKRLAYAIPMIKTILQEHRP